MPMTRTAARLLVVVASIIFFGRGGGKCDTPDGPGGTSGKGDPQCTSAADNSEAM